MVIKLRERGLGVNTEMGSSQNFLAESHNMSGSKTSGPFYRIDCSDRKGVIRRITTVMSRSVANLAIRRGKAGRVVGRFLTNSGPPATGKQAVFISASCQLVDPFDNFVSQSPRSKFSVERYICTPFVSGCAAGKHFNHLFKAA